MKKNKNSELSDDEKKAAVYVATLIKESAPVSYNLLQRIVKKHFGISSELLADIIQALKKAAYIRQKGSEIYWIAGKNPRFDAPRQARKEKWYAIFAYNGTVLLTRQVVSFNLKSKATNMARDLVGKLFKGKAVTSVVLEGPFKTMMQASKVEAILPPPQY